MDGWRARVVEAAADWVYLPDDALREVNEGYALVGYGPTFSPPTQVSRIRSPRSPADLVAEVDAVVARWGRSRVGWWIDTATRPSGLEAYLIDRGATLAETVTVLALDLTGPLPDFAVPAGVTAAVARDEAAFRTFARVEAEAWEHTAPGDDFVARWTADLDRGEFRVLGSVDGRPCATGGLTVSGDVAKVWGGATVPEYRGRGAYRAVLAERLRVARDHGAEIGLVKGRVSTSGPILRRLGFHAFDDERAYVRPITT